MVTKTDIANNALAYLSSGSIISIGDDDDDKSRVIRSVFDTVAKEVIRSHRWSCCIKRETLSKLSESPTVEGSYGYAHRYQLPSDSLRFLDLNGEPWADKSRAFDINGRELHTDEAVAHIRYVAYIEDTTQWDVMLAEAVAIKLAMRIARRITKDGISAESLYKYYREVLAQAQKVDAMEVGSGENSPLEGILAASPLVQMGQTGRYRNIAARVGLNVDSSVDRGTAPDLDQVFEEGLE